MFLTDISCLSEGSHQIVPINCQLNISEKCKKTVELEYRTILKIINNNNGKYICFYCSRQSNARNNSKYNIDVNFFKTIDSEEKAYLLGWIASDGHISYSGFTIGIHKKDLAILEKLRDIICEELPINEYNENIVNLQIFSIEMSKDLCKLLKLDFEEKGSHKKDSLVQFPDLQTEELKWHFLRGYFDGDGCISINKKKYSEIPRSSISSNSQKMLNKIKEFCNIKCTLMRNDIIWIGMNAIQFLNKLYNNSSIYLERKYKNYLYLKDWFPHKSKILETFKYTMLTQQAYKPYKTTRSAPAYMLHLIKKIKEKKDITYYDTCIKIEPKPGYYLKLKALNIIYDLGYDLVNDGEFIDEKYTGTIIAKIMKIDDEAPELELPIKLIEIVPIKKE